MLIFTMPPPSLVADGHNVLCAAWTDARHGDPDALLRCSAKGGRRWGPLRRLNDDALGNGRTQYLPRISVSPGGRLDAVFFDRRDDPENLLNHLYYAYSTDGARSFTRNVRLTQDATDSQIGQQYVNVSATGQFEFGARLALLSRDGDAVAAWPDTRNSRRGTTEQDLFAVEVSLSSDSHQPVIARIAGAALVLAGVAVLVIVVARRKHRVTQAPEVEL
jgi:hypothetical protein